MTDSSTHFDLFLNNWTNSNVCIGSDLTFRMFGKWYVQRHVYCNSLTIISFTCFEVFTWTLIRKLLESEVKRRFRIESYLLR